MLPLAILAAALFGGAWAFLPGYLQAARGSHTVITTIMFNFLAAILLNYLLVDVLIAAGQQNPQTIRFDQAGWQRADVPARSARTRLAAISGRSADHSKG